jgi:hypothetical protein
MHFSQKQNQQIFSLVIFNLHKLDNNIYVILEVQHPLYSLILQGFVLLQVVNYYWYSFALKIPHQWLSSDSSKG